MMVQKPYAFGRHRTLSVGYCSFPRAGERWYSTHWAVAANHSSHTATQPRGEAANTLQCSVLPVFCGYCVLCLPIPSCL